MKKSLVISISVLLTFIGFGQTKSFEINWEEGEKKTIYYSTIEEEMNINGEWEEKSTEEYDAEIEVLKNNDELIKFRYSVENIAMAQIAEFIEGVDSQEEIPLDDLKLIFEYNKSSHDIELKNWKEARDFITGSLDAIIDYFKKEKPEEADFLELIFTPISSMFEEKEIAQSQFITDVEFLFIPFQMEYELDQAIESTDSAPNPFDASDEISATSMSTLTQKKNGDYNVERVIELDMDVLKDLLKEMMISMFKAFMPEGEELPEDKLKELDQMEMKSTLTQNVVFNESTGWVTSSVNVASIDGSDPMSGERHARTTSTVTVK